MVNKRFFCVKVIAHDCTENSKNNVFKNNCVRTVMCKKLYHKNLAENKGFFGAKVIAHDYTENSKNSIFKRNCVRTVMCKKFYHDKGNKGFFGAKLIVHDCTEIQKQLSFCGKISCTSLYERNSFKIGCPWTKMSHDQNVHGTEMSTGPKCPQDRNVHRTEMSRDRNVHGTEMSLGPKCPWDRNVPGPKCPLDRNVPGLKCPWDRNVRTEMSLAEMSGTEMRISLNLSLNLSF